MIVIAMVVMAMVVMAMVVMAIDTYGSARLLSDLRLRISDSRWFEE